jgi:ssDNA-binding Zn-finger/Zn-ribbon topoisomerase 1
MTKTCPKCRETLELSEFAKDRSKAAGVKSHCKSCDNARSRRYYRQNSEGVIRRITRYHREAQA